jgi:hypothetical protein
LLLALGTIETGQHTTDDVFVDLDAKSLGQMLGNLGTTKARIAPLEFTNDLDEFSRRSFRTRLASGS